MKVEYQVHPLYENLTEWVLTLPDEFEQGKGTLIYKGRNELRRFEMNGLKIVVKSFQIPHLLNRMVYGNFRASKAQRSYEYALKLLQEGLGTPTPVAWLTLRHNGLMGRSFYASLESECPHTYAMLMGGQHPEQKRYLEAIARYTAHMHEKGILHKDYSLGNILLGDSPEGVKVETIDLNRLRFFSSVSIEVGCRNLFDGRLPGTREMREILAHEYARARGADPSVCLHWVDVCETEQNQPKP